ncbi:MAG: LysR family transcriptional regulator [Oscillospiraceae bacterium]|nr:LysR family transcriptional regulator [Oscillospiraceae bacterium]
MEIFNLICFLTLVENGHFYKAADELYISQSALSRHIQSLEKELNVKLIIRTPAGVELSDAGRAFIPYAKTITQEHSRMMNAVTELKSSRRRTLNIYAFSYLTAYGLQSMLAEFENDNPDIALNIVETETDICLDMLAEDPGAVAITYDPMEPDPVCSDRIELAADHITVIARYDSDLASCQEISMRALKNRRIQIFSRESSPFLNSFLSAQCQRFDLVPDEKAGMWYTTLSGVISRYNTVSLLPSKIAELAKSPDVRIIPVYDAQPLSVVVSVHRGGEGGSREALRFLDFARRFDRA